MTYYCSFCGKSHHDVRNLIAAYQGSGIFICNECVHQCCDFLNELGLEYKPKYSPMISRLNRWIRENKE